MHLRPLTALLLAALLLGCAETVPAPVPVGAPQGSSQSQSLSAKGAERLVVPDAAARAFVRVADRVEPVAERNCRERGISRNCDFEIVVDDRASSLPNAYQTLDVRGRPVIVFTLSLIAFARNEDELAFILSHETAHHVLGHIAQAEAAASAGAQALSSLAGAVAGANSNEARIAAELGAAVGARRYSKEYELEADALGAIIAAMAGYDPLNGAAIFARLPDPPNRLLSSHPSNRERLAAVRRALAGAGLT